MLVQIESLCKTYQANGRAVPALQDVSLKLDAGQFFALRGPSGCGKSTLLLAAGGLLRPDSGQVTIDDEDLYSLSPEIRAQFRATNIGFVFQQFHLVPYLNVLENVLTASLGLSGDRRAESHRRASELVDQFGLTDRMKHRPGQLSTGERQRTALARALLNRPKLLLADEPTGNLDEENSETVLKHLSRFATAGGAVLLVTHDLSAAQHAHMCLKMENGKMLES